MVSAVASLVAGRWFGWEVLQVGVRGSAAWHAAVVEKLEVALTRNQLAVPTEVLGEHQLVLTRLQAPTSARRKHLLLMMSLAEVHWLVRKEVKCKRKRMAQESFEVQTEERQMLVCEATSPCW